MRGLLIVSLLGGVAYYAHLNGVFDRVSDDMNLGGLVPEIPDVSGAADVPKLTFGRVDKLRDLIGSAESKRNGYNAVQLGAKIKPSKVPTQMTLREIYAWIEATPNQQHAIGRYQFIPATLKRLVTSAGIGLDETFSSKVQNKLCDILLLEAGYEDIVSGQISRKTFMNNLAKIWAGLPNSSGKSHYDGYAGNSASITWTKFDAEMQKIFPNSTS
jgi:hypothetical protein